MVRRQSKIGKLVVALGVCSVFLPPAIAQELVDRLGGSSEQPAQQSAELVSAVATGSATSFQAEPQTPETDPIEAVPNRPTFSTTALTVHEGILEAEYGFEGGRSHQNINGLVKFGLSKSLELRFANNPAQRDSGTFGSGDSGAGFKWKLLSQRKARPDFAVLYTATIPTSSNQLGVGAIGHSVVALVSSDFGKEHFDVNEGVFFLGHTAPGSGFDRSYLSALSWSRSVGGKWGVTAEVSGFSRANFQTSATMTILGATTYSVSPRFVLDAGAYVAVYGDLPRATFVCGVTYSVADLYHSHRTTRSVGIVSQQYAPNQGALEEGVH